MAGMVTREDGEPRAPVSLVMMLLGFAAGEWLGGFLAGFLISQFKKWGGFGGWGIDGHRAGSYAIASGAGFLRKHPKPSLNPCEPCREGRHWEPCQPGCVCTLAMCIS